VSAADGKVLVELDFVRLFLFKVVSIATEAESVGFGAGTLDVADLDWQVKSVLLGLKRAEVGEDVTNLV